MTRDFGFSLDKVNWLGNVINVTYLPTSVIVPIICTRYGIRMTVRCSVALGCSVECKRLMGYRSRSHSATLGRHSLYCLRGYGTRGRRIRYQRMGHML